MPRTNLKRVQDVENGLVTFTDIDTAEELVVDMKPFFGGQAVWDKIPEIGRHFATHGGNAKLGDKANKSGPGERIPAVTSMRDQVANGDWTARGEGSGPRISLLAEALFNIMSRHGAKMPDGSEPTLAAVGEHIAECGDEQRKAYKSRSDVDLEISEIRKARDEAKLKEKRKAVKGQEFEPLTLG